MASAGKSIPTGVLVVMWISGVVGLWFMSRDLLARCKK